MTSTFEWPPHFVKKRIFLISVLCIFFFSLFAQSPSASESIYKEYLYLHLNSNFFLTGETLFYKVYSRKEDNTPSELSSLAFVELIGEDQKPFFQVKVPLRKGMGAGDFFIPASMPSGNYTLIAYTRWMRNFSLTEFWRTQITVVNPYLKRDDATSKQTTPSAQHTERKKETGITGKIQVSLSQKKYNTRGKAQITIQNTDTVVHATLSVNVHLLEPRLSTKETIIDQHESSALLSEAADVKFLPDMRGELITGEVFNKNTKQPLINGVVYLSVPSKDFVFLTSRTDSLGRFFFSLRNPGTSPALLFQLASADAREFNIHVTSGFLEDHSAFTPSALVIDTTFRKLIERRNIFSQIENAYYTVKKDSILSDRSHTRFYGTPDKSYSLDAYARFPAMEDIFREYIPEVVVKKKNERFELQLVSSVNSIRLTRAPLVLLDGIPISDMDILMNYNPLRIRQIEIVARRYFYSALQTDGIISLQTYDGDAKDLVVPGILQIPYIMPQSQKLYYSPAYDDKKDLSRIPDYRTQLFWNPSLEVSAHQKVIADFYTSDITGHFTVEVNGFGSDGSHIHFQQVISVAVEKP